MLLSIGLTILISILMKQVNIVQSLGLSINPYEATSSEQINFYENFIIFISIVAYILIILSMALKIYISRKITKIERDISKSKNKKSKYLRLLFKILFITCVFIIIALSLLVVLIASIDVGGIPI